MERGFVYTRWLLTLTFFCLMGLLAVGMMTVHSKRTLRALAVDINQQEAVLEELSRRQDILNADLASSLNPVYLKQLIGMSGLELGPPREDRIIVVPGPSSSIAPSFNQETSEQQARFRSRFQVANNQTREGN